MGRDGSNNLRSNINSEQFGLDDPRHYGFDEKRPQVREHMDQSLSSYKPTRITLGKRPLIATQDYMIPEKVAKIAASNTKSDTPPLIMRHEGKDYVWDGHHRIAGALAKGQKSMTVGLNRTAF
jgi:hypothetical protein